MESKYGGKQVFPLRKLRTERGISASVLATEINVDSNTINQWERGVEIPNADAVMRLAEFLNLPLKDIYLAILNTPLPEQIGSA